MPIFSVALRVPIPRGDDRYQVVYKLNYVFTSVSSLSIEILRYLSYVYLWNPLDFRVAPGFDPRVFVLVVEPMAFLYMFFCIKFSEYL